MGRQTRFYMMDERNVRTLAEAFGQNGFELILSKRIQNEDGKVSVIFEPTRIDNSVLVQNNICGVFAAFENLNTELLKVMCHRLALSGLIAKQSCMPISYL